VFERVLAQSAQSVLERLKGIAEIRSFYLAGGTGLALQLGHRRSVDLDFFTAQSFDAEALAVRLKQVGSTETTLLGTRTLKVSIDDIETSFFPYPHPLLFPTLEYRGVAVASWVDILCMKVAAVGQRAAKRDYVDVYFGLKKGLALRELMDLVKKKYSDVQYSEYHLLRSLMYFDEIESEPMPVLFRSVSWEAICRFLRKQVQKTG